MTENIKIFLNSLIAQDVTDFVISPGSDQHLSLFY